MSKINLSRYLIDDYGTCHQQFSLREHECLELQYILKYHQKQVSIHINNSYQVSLQGNNTYFITMSHRKRNDSWYVVIVGNWPPALRSQDVYNYLRKYQIRYLSKQFHKACQKHKSRLLLYYETQEEAYDARRKFHHLNKIEQFRIDVQMEFSKSEQPESTLHQSGSYGRTHESSRLPEHSSRFRLLTLDQYRCQKSQKITQQPVELNELSMHLEYGRDRNVQKEYSITHSPFTKQAGQKYDSRDQPQDNHSRRRSRSRSRHRSRSDSHYRNRESSYNVHTENNARQNYKQSSKRLDSLNNMYSISTQKALCVQNKIFQKQRFRDQKYTLEQNTLQMSNIVIEKANQPQESNYIQAEPELISLGSFNPLTSDISALPAKIKNQHQVFQKSMPTTNIYASDHNSNPMANTLSSVAQSSPLQFVIPTQKHTQNFIVTTKPNTVDVSPTNRIHTSIPKTFNSIQFKIDITKAKDFVNIFIRNLGKTPYCSVPSSGSLKILDIQKKPLTIDLTVPYPTVIPKKRKT